MQKILLIENDQTTVNRIEEVLNNKFNLQIVSAPQKAIENLEKDIFDLIILGIEINLLEIFNKIRKIAPALPVIILSTSSDIALAVKAAKLGVSDFVRKPLDLKTFEEAILKTLSQEALPAISLHEREDLEWLESVSPKISNLLKALTQAIYASKGILFIAEPGLPINSLAKLVHSYSRFKNKKLVSLDLLTFQREMAETQFWAMLRNLLKPSSEVMDERDLCGSLYLQGFEGLEDHFQMSVLNFIKDKIGEINIILEVRDEKNIAKFKRENLLANFKLISIPALRERKEDIPLLIDIYLKKFSEQFNKHIGQASADLFAPLMYYAFPGNITELQSLIKTAVLAAASESIGIENLPLDLNMILTQSLKQTEALTLEKAKIYFEKYLFSAVLQKCKGDQSSAARFLDLPKTTFEQRAQNLGL